MADLRERIAKQLLRWLWGTNAKSLDRIWNYVPAENRETALAGADAILAELRTPDDAMLKAAMHTLPGVVSRDELCEADIEDIWATMVSAALREEQQTDG
jgi:hypothetical protein